MERKKQTGHVCRWMAFGITIVTIIVGCTIVIGYNAILISTIVDKEEDNGNRNRL